MSGTHQPDPDLALRQAASRSPQCLTIEQLDGYERQSVSKRDAEAIAAHLLACPYCTNELAMLREFLTGDVPASQQADVQWVARSLEQNRGRLLDAARRPDAQTRQRWWESLSALFTIPKLSFASAALVLVVSAGLYLRQRPITDATGEFTDSSVYRSGRITGVLPAGDIATIPDKVVWNAVPSAQKYQVRMLEVDGNELWKISVPGNSTALPRSATIHISFTKTLLLEVAAFNEAGKQIAISETTRFRLMTRGK